MENLTSKTFSCLPRTWISSEYKSINLKLSSLHEDAKYLFEKLILVTKSGKIYFFLVLFLFNYKIIVLSNEPEAK